MGAPRAASDHQSLDARLPLARSHLASPGLLKQRRHRLPGLLDLRHGDDGGAVPLAQEVRHEEDLEAGWAVLVVQEASRMQGRQRLVAAPAQRRDRNLVPFAADDEGL